MFGVIFKIRSSFVFWQTLGAIFSSQTTLGAIFAWIFRNFAQIFNKSKLLGVRLHPCYPGSYTTVQRYLISSCFALNLVEQCFYVSRHSCNKKLLRSPKQTACSNKRKSEG